MPVGALLLQDTLHALRHFTPAEQLASCINIPHIPPGMHEREPYRRRKQKTAIGHCDPPHHLDPDSFAFATAASVASTTASSRRCAMKLTSVIPSTLCN